jgi:hypothetical protein
VNVTGFTKEGEEIPLILDNVWQLD